MGRCNVANRSLFLLARPRIDDGNGTDNSRDAENILYRIIVLLFADERQKTVVVAVGIPNYRDTCDDAAICYC